MSFEHNEFPQADNVNNDCSGRLYEDSQPKHNTGAGRTLEALGGSTSAVCGSGLAYIGDLEMQSALPGGKFNKLGGIGMVAVGGLFVADALTDHKVSHFIARRIGLEHDK